MPWWLWTVLAALAVHTALVLALAATGCRTDARALAGFVPDCVVLCARLARDPRVPRRHRLALAALAAYLALPVDLVPDVIPVVGQLDDALAVALVLRRVLAGGGEALLGEHWPGPERSLGLVRRLVVGAAPGAAARR